MRRFVSTGSAGFFIGEFVKVALTLGLLAVAIKKYTDLHWPSLLVGMVLEHHADRIWTVAVHVDQRVETAPGAGEQPVDGTFLVAFHMVVIELTQEIVTNAVVALALDVQRLFDESQIFLIALFAKSYSEKSFEAFCYVVGEPVAIEHGDDVVVIWKKVDSG